MKRQRRPTEPGEFSDPLKNYDTPVLDDDLERALIESTLTDMQTRPFQTIAPTTTVQQAIKTMIDLNIACLMVAEGDRLLGIFSERDVLDKVADNYAQAKSKPVSDVMTAAPLMVHETDSPAIALNLMAVHGFRHVPILDVDEHVVGIVGPRRITAFIAKYLRD